LFERNFDDVWKFARRRCDSAADADDITAETFATAWRRRDQIPPTTARLWLFTATRHVVANQQRANLRRDRLLDKLNLDALVPPPPPVDLIVDARHGFEILLQELPELDREILTMSAWDVLTVTEIARSPTSTRTRYLAASTGHDNDSRDR
jgi:RNA polymerase sigma factor (sigma-70 family)